MCYLVQSSKGHLTKKTSSIVLPFCFHLLDAIIKSLGVLRLHSISLFLCWSKFFISYAKIHVVRFHQFSAMLLFQNVCFCFDFWDAETRDPRERPSSYVRLRDCVVLFVFSKKLLRSKLELFAQHSVWNKNGDSVYQNRVRASRNDQQSEQKL